jgi:outer membrane murein-binding lipoprotein Lpp
MHHYMIYRLEDFVMKKILAALAISAIILAGCSNEEEQLEAFYNDFQETVKSEEDMQDINEEFSALETEREELQEELTEADEEALQDISKELIDNTKGREELIEDENSVMTASQEEAESSKATLEEVEDESFKEEGELLLEAADERYEAHSAMLEQLSTTLDAEKSVFEYLQEGNITQDDLDERINELNEEYEELTTLQNDFDTATNRVNELKGEIRELID